MTHHARHDLSDLFPGANLQLVDLGLSHIHSPLHRPARFGSSCTWSCCSSPALPSGEACTCEGTWYHVKVDFIMRVGFIHVWKPPPGSSMHPDPETGHSPPPLPASCSSSLWSAACQSAPASSTESSCPPQSAHTQRQT